MRIPLYQVDAFAESLFKGNPAAVCPLQEWLTGEVMQKIAAENNLSETAFFIREDNSYSIRWFTPLAEVDLCGHATLASAHIIFNYLGYNNSQISFQSKSGELLVKKAEDLIVLDFPSARLRKTDQQDALEEALGANILELWEDTDYLALLGSEDEVQGLKPDLRALLKFGIRGVIVTAEGSETDFVSRFFAPGVGIDEDPVTGSAHTMLIPFWSEKLQKTEMMAKQISERGGMIYCRQLGERVEIGGRAITYLEGEIIL